MLKELGLQEGDTVRIEDYEFEYYDVSLICGSGRHVELKTKTTGFVNSVVLFFVEKICF
mgnify:CR=1 FL=1